MKRFLFLSILLTVAYSTPALAADSVMFNYQGRVRVQGSPFDGAGQFKFAILNTSGATTLWSNDGTSVAGNEPTNSVSIDVTEGTFNVMVGDTTLGMEPINSTIFNYPTPLKLRIWFSDGVHGFQRLLPDHTLVNPQLIGLTTGTEDFTIYVDGVNGVDTNNGLTTATAKKTIQAAVDVLPERLRANVTIDIADGVYREEVSVCGIVVEAGKSLLFKGDETWTPASTGDPAVRITGTDDDATHTATRQFAIISRNCSGIAITGILADYCSNKGFEILEGSAIFRNCKATHCEYCGIDFRNNSSGACYSCVTEHVANWGFVASSNSTVALYDCVAQYNTCGATANTNAALSFKGTGVYSNNTRSGIELAHLARAIFFDTYSGRIENNGVYGIDIRYNSYTEDDARWNTYSGNGTANVHLQWGGAQYY